MILNLAKNLNINYEGKTTEQLSEEIILKAKEKETINPNNMEE